MEKATFLEKAPIIYALAIVNYLESNSSSTFREELQKHYTIRDEDDMDPDNEFELFDNHAIFRAALKWLMLKGIIDVIEDDFGPPLIQQTKKFRDALNILTNDKSTSFYIYSRATNKIAWVISALRNVYNEQFKLDIKATDFTDANNQWEPIALSNDDAKLKETITNIQTTLDQVSGLNDYAQHSPEEREFVISGLSVLLERMRGFGTISRPYIEQYGIVPLRAVARRFANDAVGVASQVAIASLKEWLRAKGFPL